MTAIARVHARQLLDSRGNPTLEVDVVLESGALGRAAVPSGASTGEHEAVELRDGDPTVYLGKGVLGAVANVNGEIADAVAGLDASDQRALDAILIELDGTPTKSRLGANAIWAAPSPRPRRLLRTPACRSSAGSAATRLATLPVPLMNVINGGVHAQNRLDLQEFMLVPAGAETFSEALRVGAEVFHALKAVLHERGLATGVGDEGGFAPDLESTSAAIEAVLEAAGRAGHRDRVAIALDPAASEVYPQGAYHLPGEGRTLTPPEMVEFYAGAGGSLPARLDRGRSRRERVGGLARADEALGDRVQLVGDDLFVTNVDFLRRGVEEGVANAILVKVNQIGTLTESLDVSRWRAPPATRRSSRTGRARRRTRRSPTSRSRSTPARSRPERRRAPIASRSTTSSSGSRKSSAMPRRTRAGPPSGRVASLPACPFRSARRRSSRPSAPRRTTSGRSRRSSRRAWTASA